MAAHEPPSSIGAYSGDYGPLSFETSIGLLQNLYLVMG
jgi:hypothetical protein